MNTAIDMNNPVAMAHEIAQLRSKVAALEAVLLKCERLAWEVGSETEDGVHTILEDERGDLWREIVHVLDLH